MGQTFRDSVIQALIDQAIARSGSSEEDKEIHHPPASRLTDCSPYSEHLCAKLQAKLNSPRTFPLLGAPPSDPRHSPPTTFGSALGHSMRDACHGDLQNVAIQASKLGPRTTHERSRAAKVTANDTLHSAAAAITCRVVASFISRAASLAEP